MSIKHLLRSSVLPLALALAVMSPSEAAAQRRGPVRRAPVRPVAVRPLPVRPFVIYTGWGWGYPFAPVFAYDWYQYPYPYPPYRGGRYGRFDDTAAIRLEVTPREAEVYVDGYRVGIVDDFDGIFQRLRVPPGDHEIVLYDPGYRTVRQRLYVARTGSQRIRFAMEPLRAGEVAEPPPAPPRGPVGPAQPRTPPQGPPPRPSEPQGPPPPPRPEPRPMNEPRGPFGSLAIRVQPADAEILVDGEPWSMPEGQTRLVVELSEGRHHVEVRKTGFNTYTGDVLIRANGTLTLNVSLLRGGAQ